MTGSCLGAGAGVRGAGGGGIALLNRLETTLLAGAFGVGLSLPLFTVGVDGAGVTGGLKSEVGGPGVDGGSCGGAGALGGL